MTGESNNPRKMGLTMIMLAWGVLFVLLALYFDDWLGEQQNPNQAPVSRVDGGRTEVILQPNRQHHYVVSGSINQYPVTFLLDTGATDVVIPYSLAKTIGLRRGAEQRASTANGIIRVYQTELDTLQFGEIILRDVKASINPAMDNTVVLLGMSALRKVQFEQRGQALILRQ